MKILLIHPPNSKVSIAPGRFEPLALEVLAACVPGHDVRIIDLRFDGLKTLDFQLNSFQPHVAGITVNNTIHVNLAKKIINHIVLSYPEVKLIVGGFHATMMPQEFRIPGVHAIFLGWAEKSFPQYIEANGDFVLLREIDGIEILNKGQVQFRNQGKWNLEASDVPYPRRDLIRKYQKRYRSDMGFRTALINTTRGCPNRCTFCGVWQVAKGHFVLRNPEDVYKEIADLPSYIHRVFFADDNTFIDPENAKKLCHMIRDGKIHKKYSGYCRSDTIVQNPDLMKEWREIGLDNLCVGFEVTNSERLNDLNKRNSEENNVKAAQILNDLGVPFRPHFLIEPSFIKEDFDKLINYVRLNRLKSPIFPILTPIPGTVYYKEVMDKIMVDYDCFDYAHSTVPTALGLKDFYKYWVGLYYKSYSIEKNLRYFFISTFSKLIGNISLQKKYSNLKLINLLMLRLFGLYLHLKIIRHYKSMNKM